MITLRAIKLNARIITTAVLMRITVTHHGLIAIRVRLSIMVLFHVPQYLECDSRHYGVAEAFKSVNSVADTLRDPFGIWPFGAERVSCTNS